MDERIGRDERDMIEAVRSWVDREVRPVVRDLEHANEYPAELIEMMKGMGVFGLLVPIEHGGLEVSAACFAAVTRELCRGWMSLGGAMGGHSVVVALLREFGTDNQRARYLPSMATGELRATMALTEPAGGSDLQSITTVANPDDNGLRIRGQKTWISNADTAGLIALLAKTNPAADPPYRGISVLLVDKRSVGGVAVGPPMPKLGYKGVASCEVTFDDTRVPADALLGDAEGAGFRQMMRGLELGRIQVAARAVGVATAALDDALGYAQERETFGRPIWKHQAIGHYLADMGTDLRAAELLTVAAAECYDGGQRADMEAGMAKLFASEACMRIVNKALRIHGGYGYSTEFDVERYYRDAPLMVVGEGTNEIQRNVIVEQMVRRHG